jgi:hypothetical protein
VGPGGFGANATTGAGIGRELPPCPRGMKQRDLC